MEFDLFIQYGPMLLRGLMNTVLCWIAGATGSIILGFCVAVGLHYGPAYLRYLLRTYVEIIRGTPFLIQLFILYYGGPHFGLRLDPVPAGILGLIIYGSPYYAEIFRAGLQSVPTGLVEAGRAMALPETTILRRIVLPVLMVSSVPALTNFSIILTKETAILSIVTVPELLYQVQTMSAETFAFVEATFVLAMFYWGLVEVISYLGRKLERKTNAFLSQEPSA
ncbi:MAG: amino acid ABC transporter permease [Sulfitobacter sp.]